MAQEHVYKVLFFVQSAAFIMLIISYSQNPGVLYGSRLQPSPKARVTNACNCSSNKTTLKNETVHLCMPVQNDIRGPLSNCTLADVMKRSKVMLLSTTNLGFLDITLNMLESIKRIGVCVNTTIIAEDQKCYRYLSKRAEADPAVHVVLTNSGESTSKEILRTQRRQYYALFNKRQSYLLTMLQQGLDVLFSDADTFWFRDPFPFFKGDFDISLIDSISPYPVRTNRGDYCAGFVYYKPTNATLQLVNTWIQTMQENDKKGKLLADQSVLNGLVHADKPVYVRIKPLDTNIFPWGPKFYSLLEKKANYSTVVMHAASIRGRAAKIAKFKSSNMWLVNSTIEEIAGQA
ncbi:UDP-galactose:fucoside alpha-3-galactosyltransferase-like [Acanthaster planci]|uniref:UDP-galactose:fucoside alpha-3-galactosyltransferase-like n=1 Tax=Acanthaster planci TaxID=133434 RepID=A0A8B7ZX29_ACAPL|nr:UDP-galactose:fucoside alpha-3-galactosyltransferase-like [Acanthaster planci]XP_022109320.1 UDP-galactose:fucoside alpha-3-galactosyltransferase-like [Acanthaster planci]